MDTDVKRQLSLDMIGQPVEVGIYNKKDDEWVGTDAGLLTSYTLTPYKCEVSIARSSTVASESRWNFEEHYILVTVIARG